MSRQRIIGAAIFLLFVGMVIMSLCTGARAQTAPTISAGVFTVKGVTPADATANSIFTITFTYKHNGLLWDSAFIELVAPGKTSVVIPIYEDQFGNLSGRQRLPRNATDPNFRFVSAASDGTVTYELSFTSGLRLSLLGGKLPPATDPDIYFAQFDSISGTQVVNPATGAITAYQTGTGTSYVMADFSVYPAPALTYVPHILSVFPPVGTATTPTVADVTGASFTVHDAAPNVLQVDQPYWHGPIGSWAGIDWDKDFLWSYNEYLDHRHDVDPVATSRADGQTPDISDDSDSISGTPDDGTTSTNYTFRVLYTNQDGLPPMPYIPSGQLNYMFEDPLHRSGVVLYLWDPLFRDYVTFPMYPAAGEGTDYKAGVIYEYTFGYKNRFRPMMDGTAITQQPFPGLGYPDLPYVSLPVGAYSYFFGCSDDNLLYSGSTQASADAPIWADQAPWTPGSPQDSYRWEWGQDDYYPYPVDNDYNMSRYVDRPTYQPGVPNAYRALRANYAGIYPYPASVHPVVSLGLYGARDDNGLLFEGRYPWRGAMTPFRRMVDPVLNPYINQYCETCGVAANTRVSFRIRYAQLFGVLPEDKAGGEINVWINNAETDMPPGYVAGSLTPAQFNLQYPLYVYNKYPLSQVLTDDGDLSAQDTSKDPGVLYQSATPITLAPGPHTFYYEASDGQKIVHFPVRPRLQSFDRGLNATTGGANLQCFNGPYVNNRPQLFKPIDSEMVTPRIGTAGDNFRFAVTYKDVDGQRPYQAHVIIQWRDGGTLENGGAVRATMTMKTPVQNPDFTQGITYVFDSSNLGQQLQPGARKFYFEFIDDWGGRSDAQDKVMGEKVWSSTNPGGSYSGPVWMDGPYIGANHRPVLTNGSVSSADQTSNVATVWNYKVNYKDADGQKPQYINVYLGRGHNDGTITWDNGHAMQEVTTSDQIYTDGKDYIFSGTVEGGDPPSNYYYCFAATDGIDVAQYDAATSESADVIWNTPDPTGLTTGTPGERISAIDPGNTVFATSQHPLVGVIQPNPVYNLYSYPIVHNDQGALLQYMSDYTVDFADGLITLLTSSSQYLDVQYFFGVPGPNSVGANTSPTLSNGTVTPNPGFSTASYKFDVVYTDPDGPAGQAPSYVNVIIDGVTYLMTKTVLGAPNYKSGVKYEKVIPDTTTTTRLAPGVHNYYFEASDGVGYAMYDATGGHSSGNTINGYTPITGPYINDYPTLTNASISPNALSPNSIDIAQAITYQVTYTDNNNEGPNAGYPVVYIDNKNEVDYSGSVTGVGAVTITDANHGTAWIPSQFKGEPIQFLSGNAQGSVYVILDNTAYSLTLLASDLVNQDGIRAGDKYSICKLLLFNNGGNTQNYVQGVTSGITIPGLGAGLHTAHFTSITQELISDTNPQYRTTPTRTPEISGPNVTASIPANTKPPVLSNEIPKSPASVLSGHGITFGVTYTDPNGYPPSLYNARLGYINVVVDGITYPMTGPGNPQYLTGADFTYVDPASNTSAQPGPHLYHFQASDGYLVARWPLIGDFTLNVNSPPTLSSPQVLPIRHNSGRAYKYSVVYTDINGDSPNGDPVNGAPQLWIDGVLVNPVDMDINGNITQHNYTVTNDGSPIASGRTYTYILKRDVVHGETDYFAGQPAGLHNFMFKASDGKESGPDSAQTDGPYVHDNNAPSLSLWNVSKNAGYDLDDYVFTVNYLDPDGDDPQYVYLDVDGGQAAGGSSFLMTQSDPNATDYTVDVLYTVTVHGLAVGVHQYAFRASDWLETAATPQAGTSIVVSPRPAGDITISPMSGIVYAAVPAVVNGTVNTPKMPITMSIIATRPSGPQPAAHTNVKSLSPNWNFSDSWTFDIPGIWTVQAHWAGNNDFNGTDSAPLTINVQPRPVATLDINTDTAPVMGGSANIVGHIYFDSSDGTPPSNAVLTISGTNGSSSFTKQVTTSATTKTSGVSSAAYTVSWSPSGTGTWQLTATWAGNTVYARASKTKAIQVSGPSVTVSGLEMISIPMVPTSGFPDSVMGRDPAYALARWLPSLTDYRIYSWFTGGRQDIDYPPIAAGQGFWIKTTQAKTISPSGYMWPSGTDCTINLSSTGSGWNQIGSPFIQEVPWSSLRVQSNGSVISLDTAAANGLVRNYGWRYDSTTKGYVLVNSSSVDNTMKPWMGYWIRALSDCQLVIPAPLGLTSTSVSSSSKSSMHIASTAEDPGAWLVTLTASNATAKGSAQFGGNAASASTIDSPSPLEDYVEMYFTETKAGHCAVDVRSKSDTDTKWTLKVASDTTGDVELKWDGIQSIPAGSTLTLLDLATGKSVTMSPNGSYVFHLDENTHVKTFRISL